MIPTNQILTTPIEETASPTRTYNILVDYNRVSGFTDDLEAVAQAIYLILNTERYEHIIYSWDYGVEFVDLYGKPISYVVSEVERRITEALLQDDRIEEVSDFSFEKKGKILHVTFNVRTIYGNIEIEKEVTT